MRNNIDKKNDYNTFEIVVNGKKREITSVDKECNLYVLQRNLLDGFLNKIPLPNNVCGFVKGKSYLDFLTPHCRKKYYLRLDIENFFGSIKVRTIKEVLKEYIQTSDQIKDITILNVISNIVTYKRSLPQGAVTSPQISNVVFRRLDIRIRNYCRKFDIEYTRYADDILFSSDSDYLHKDSFYKMIYKILNTLKFRINKKKVLMSENKLILNGYVISDKISLSRKKLRLINSYIYAFENYNGKKKYPSSFQEYEKRLRENSSIDSMLNSESAWIDIIQYLSGYRSYLINFSKERYEDKSKGYPKTIKKIEKILDIVVNFKS